MEHQALTRSLPPTTALILLFCYNSSIISFNSQSLQVKHLRHTRTI